MLLVDRVTHGHSGISSQLSSRATLVLEPTTVLALSEADAGLGYLQGCPMSSSVVAFGQYAAVQ